MKIPVNLRILTIAALSALAAVATLLFTDGSPQRAQDAPNERRAGTFEKYKIRDAVTADIRDVRKEVVRVEISSIQDRAKAGRLGRTVADHGSFLFVSRSRSAATEPSGLKVERLDTTLNLPGERFDPLGEQRPETVADEPGGAKNQTGYFIVQFGAVAGGDWIESLTDAGVDVLQYVPHNAFLVYGSPSAIESVAGHSRVRWVGKFEAKHKLPAVLREQIAADRANAEPKGASRLEKSNETAVFDVAVFSRADLAAVASEIAVVSGGKIKNTSRLPNNFFNVVRVEMPVDNVERLAEIPDVIRVDAWSKPVAEDERAAQIVAGNYTSTTSINAPGYDPRGQFGVDGRGVTVSVVDDGVSIPGNGNLYITSANTVDAPLHGGSPGATGGHGHINASIIAGSTPYGALDELGYNYGIGVAPGANIINIPMLTSTYIATEADTYNDTIATIGPNGSPGFISNNSWGNGLNSNAYDAYAARFDGFVRDATYAATIDPIVLVFSAGNSGPGANTLTRPKTAKNMIAVGNSENIRTERGGSNADNMDDLRGSSSRGPTADGRIKPDVTAPGSYITGSRAGTSCSSVTSCFDANHSYSIGTSHAAPQVAGMAALFTEFWKNGHSGQNPSPSLVKAAILNTGQEMNGLNTTSPLPNGNEGWGRVNTKFMLNTGVAMKYVDESTPFSNVGETFTLNGQVADASKPLRIALVWTDPPGTTDPSLVNNLDLSVTVNGTVYRGNVFAGGVSVTGGNANTVDNVEQVRLPAGIPAGATVTVQVTASGINGDGILGNADSTDQHFSLVAYNVADTAAPVSKAPSDFDGDGKSDVAVWRPAGGIWYAIRSSDNTVTASAFGSQGDVIVPGDYDADGKTDTAVWRPSSGVWYINRSSQGLQIMSFGAEGDVPAAGDYDGDGKTDIGIWRPSNGVWYLQRSSAGFGGLAFGTAGDKPVPGDFDGDSKVDIAVYRPSTGTWYMLRSTAGLAITNFGLEEDRPTQADYDGDGTTDIAVWRPSTGNWYINQSTAGLSALNFGLTTDRPAPADYDGDRKTDVGVYRGSDGTWYHIRSQLGYGAARFGSPGDVAVPAGYIPQ